MGNPTNSRPLRVVGSKLINELGQETRLQGVSIPSLEWGGGDSNILDKVKTAIDPEKWNSNFIRLPLNQDRWLNDENGYRALVESIVGIVSAAGKYIELDLHWSGCGSPGTATRQYRMPDMGAIDLWKSIAQTFKNHPAVLFDLFNEPNSISWDVWRNGGRIQYAEKGRDTEREYDFESPGHQRLVEEIRAVGANNIIIAGGLIWALDLRGLVPGYDGLERGYALTDVPGSSGIMYETHIYPISSPWNNDSTDPAKNFVLCVKDLFPITIGEFGSTPIRERSDKNVHLEDPPAWLNGIMEWADRHGINWTAWCFHASAGPQMLQRPPEGSSDIIATEYFGVPVRDKLLKYPKTTTHY